MRKNPTYIHQMWYEDISQTLKFLKYSSDVLYIPSNNGADHSCFSLFVKKEADIVKF